MQFMWIMCYIYRALTFILKRSQCALQSHYGEKGQYMHIKFRHEYLKNMDKDTIDTHCQRLNCSCTVNKIKNFTL